MLKSRKIVVSGKVQGVYYRASTREVARQLGLTGWVKNMSNGDVEAITCGESADLDALQKWMQTGPDGASVTALQASEVEMQAFSDFSIIR